MAFVRESFLDSFRTAHTAGMIAMEDWDEVMGKQWEKALARPGVQIWVAYHPYEPDPLADLYGFLAVEKVRPHLDYILFCYVKADFRRWGIARGLFRAADIVKPFRYAVRTPVVTRLFHAGKLEGGVVWDPLTVRFPPT